MKSINTARPARQTLVMALCMAMLVSPAAAQQERTLELRSEGDLVSRRLPAGTRDVELEQQLGGVCRFNRSWGYDLSQMELWVNEGCAARFRLIGEFRDSDRQEQGEGSAESSSSSNAVAAVAAVAAIAGLALLASKSRDKNEGSGDWNGQQGYGRQIRGAGGLCLDISGRVREGAPAIIYGCNNGANQRFEWGPRGEIRVGGLCLDVANGDGGNGAGVIAFRCNGGENQRWRSRSGQIRSAMNGKCLDVRDARIRPGQPVQMWDCHGGQNQRWWW